MNICYLFVELYDFPSIENTISEYLKYNIVNNNCYCLYNKNQSSTNNNIKYYKLNDELKYVQDYINLDKYDYLCLLTNQFEINQQLMVEKYVSLLTSNIKQLILTKCKYNKKNTENNLEIPIIDNYNQIVNDPKFRFNYIKEVFNTIPILSAKNCNIQIDYNSYVTGNYFSYFQFLPSVIKIDNNVLKSIPIILTSNGNINLRHYNNVYINNNWISGYYDIGLNYNKEIKTIKNITDKQTLSNDMTIVTGYIKVGGGGKKHKYDYIEKAKYTLSLPNNMVVFVSKEMEHHVIEIRQQHNLMDKTRIVILDVSDLYMYDKKEYIDKCCYKNKVPYNNSLYIMAVNSRYSYLEQAIKLNYFKTNYFGWVDFGLGHIAYMDNIFPLYYNNPNKVKISWIARKNLEYNHKVLGGGIYLAHKLTMLELCRLHDLEFKLNLEQGHCINDDKTLFLIYLKYPELFDIYFSGYNLMYNKMLI